MSFSARKIAEKTQPIAAQQLVGRAQERASLLPDLLVQAEHIANSVLTGRHGRRKRGIGENFWQFRPFSDGENKALIDWRRSARDDTLYIRDRELEAVHTVWLWADPSKSMNFKSKTAQTSKQERALVLSLALAEILARSGERVGFCGAGEPITHKRAAERLALKISTSNNTDKANNTDKDSGDNTIKWPNLRQIKPLSEIVIISDFLDSIDSIMSHIDTLSKSKIRGHLVQIIDPAEANFPYQGSVTFEDPETGKTHTLSRADAIKSNYKELFQARQDKIRNLATQRGWSFTSHQTDQLASQVLVQLHLKLSEALGGGW